MVNKTNFLNYDNKVNVICNLDLVLVGLMSFSILGNVALHKVGSWYLRRTYCMILTITGVISFRKR